MHYSLHGSPRGVCVTRVAGGSVVKATRRLYMHTERDINIFVCAQVLAWCLSAVLLSAEHSTHCHGGRGNLEDTWGYRTRRCMAHTHSKCMERARFLCLGTNILRFILSSLLLYRRAYSPGPWMSSKCPLSSHCGWTWAPGELRLGLRWLQLMPRSFSSIPWGQAPWQVIWRLLRPSVLEKKNSTVKRQGSYPMYLLSSLFLIRELTKKGKSSQD